MKKNTIQFIKLLVPGNKLLISATYSDKYDLRIVKDGIIRHHGMAYSIGRKFNDKKFFVATTVQGTVAALDVKTLSGVMLGPY